MQRPCVGCRTPLVTDATHCVECGLQALEMTDGGTVVAPAPTEPPTTSSAAPHRFVPPPLPASLRAADDTPIELDLDDIEIVGARPARRWLTGDWPAPPRGQTVVGPPPFAPARITAAYGVIHV